MCTATTGRRAWATRLPQRRGAAAPRLLAVGARPTPRRPTPPPQADLDGAIVIKYRLLWEAVLSFIIVMVTTYWLFFWLRKSARKAKAERLAERLAKRLAELAFKK